jgi:geranylgeranyl diphosphate synthase type 3
MVLCILICDKKLTRTQVIFGPYDYLRQSKGKHLRAQLIELFNTVLQIPKDKLVTISNIIEMLHTASLLIDDIEDGSNLRRGKPTAHLIYGIPYTINSSNYIYFKAMGELLRLGDPVCVQEFNEELLNLHRGQSLDLYWRENLVIPREDEYIEMVMNSEYIWRHVYTRTYHCGCTNNARNWWAL